MLLRRFVYIYFRECARVGFDAAITHVVVFLSGECGDSVALGCSRPQAKVFCDVDLILGSAFKTSASIKKNSDCQQKILRVIVIAMVINIIIYCMQNGMPPFFLFLKLV